mgnify:CR=1 FL=1
MQNSKQVSHGDSSKKTPVTNTSKIIEGIITMTSKGVGYVASLDLKEDIEIAPEHVNTALHKDTVEVAVGGKNRFDRVQGTVTKIVSRNKTNFVGTVAKEGGKTFIIPDDKKMYVDIVIPHQPKDLEAPEGSKVLVRMTRWEKTSRTPEGEILEIIGIAGEHNTEMESIVRERGFDTAFPETVEAEAKAIRAKESPTPASEIATRRDFRKTLTFTIDPIDAKDFDDAISFKKLADGKFEIGVHIADVSHYVRPGTALDREAVKRGFSVYLVDRTIPMLPEILSNDLCSLNAHEDKLAFSSVFVMDSNGAISDRWFGKSIINSAKRFTYEAAQETLDAKSGEYFEELNTLNKIAYKLREEKWKNGAIDFEQDEVKFELDKAGRPIRVYRKTRKDAHKLVEEYMLLANREVAEVLYKAHNKEGQKPTGVALYRIHDVPDREKIADFSAFVRALGFDLPIRKDGEIKAKDLQALMNAVAGKAEESMIRTAAVRSMAKAIYSTANIGHFGLAFEYYTHFTSPIRRYADLVIHRILQHHLMSEKIPERDWAGFEKMAADNTEKEISAADAERASIKYKQVEYMKERIGQVFDGVISGVTEWGIYVEDKETRCEGMIKIRDIGDDFYVLDQKNYALVGEKTKRRFRLGDSIKYKVVAADMERRTLDYSLEK